MPSRLFPRDISIIINLLFAISVVANQSDSYERDAANSKVLVFGQTATYTGQAWAVANRYNAGLLAAFKEINDRGGVKGKYALVLRSYDDKYNLTVALENINKLLAMPDLFALLSVTGTPMVRDAIPLAEKVGIPLIAPVTGSPAARSRFHRDVIHLRAGYNDEGLAMLRILITRYQFKRVAILVEDDDSGMPTKLLLDNVLASLGLVFEYTQLVNLDNYLEGKHKPQLDAITADLAALQIQAVVIITVPSWAKEIIDTVYTTYPNSDMFFVVGSWMGYDVAEMLKLKRYKSTGLIQTQVTPFPTSTTSVAAEKYRAALTAYEGASSAIFDYLSFEGYLAGRLVIEALKYMKGAASPQNFLNTFYETHTFSIDDLLVGPFADSCAHSAQTGTRDEDSSLCNCSQGLRIVESVSLSSHDYTLVPLDNSEFMFSFWECVATRTMVDRPSVFVLPVRKETAPSFEATSGIENLVVGLTCSRKENRPRFAMANATADGIASVSDKHYVFGYLETDAQPELLPLPYAAGATGGIIFAGLTTSNIHPSLRASFQRDRIYILPPHDHEIYSLVTRAARIDDVHKIVLLESSAIDNSLDTLHLIEESVRTVYRNARLTPSVSKETFDGNDQTSPLPVPRSSSTFVIIVGLGSSDRLAKLVNDISDIPTAARPHVALMFAEAAAAWSALKACTRSSCAAALSNMHICSNLPLWTSSLSVFGSLFQETMDKDNIDTWTRRHPWTAVGYLIGRLNSYLLSRTDVPTPQNALDVLYRFSVVPIDDMHLGPFDDSVCLSTNGTLMESSSCTRCNVGVRYVFHYTIAEVLFDLDVAGEHITQFESCDVQYIPQPDPSSSPVAFVLGVVGGCMFLIALMLGIEYAVVIFRRNKKAPRSVPLCLILTSIEDRQRLIARYPECMPHAIEIHNRVIRRLIEDYDAYEVKYEKDTFLIAVQNLVDGVLLATDIQQCLFDSEWPEGFDPNAVALGDINPNVWNGLRVRVALHHAYDVVPKYDSVRQRFEYHGNDSLVVNRVESVTYGGQVLSCAETYEALKEMPEYATLIEGKIYHTVAPQKAEVFDKAVHPDASTVLFCYLPWSLATRQFEGEGPESGGVDEAEEESINSAMFSQHLPTQQAIQLFFDTCPRKHLKVLVSYYAKRFYSHGANNRIGGVPLRKQVAILVRSLCQVELEKADKRRRRAAERALAEGTNINNEGGGAAIPSNVTTRLFVR
eukprot:PhM_4_TR16430/c0_g1_i1/m.97126